MGDGVNATMLSETLHIVVYYKSKARAKESSIEMGVGIMRD